MHTLKPLVVALGIAALSSVAQAQQHTFPAHNYDCQVLTNTGTRALVSLQANDAKEAEEFAVNQPAVTMVGTEEISAEVTECVPAGDSFSDSSFNSWSKSLPR